MGDEQTKIYAKNPKQNTRFLGVWVNAELHRKFNTQRITDIINDFCIAVGRKKATIAQFKYLYNNVIMLRLEYLHKITLLEYGTVRYCCAAEINKLYFV